MDLDINKEGPWGPWGGSHANANPIASNGKSKAPNTIFPWGFAICATLIVTACGSALLKGAMDNYEKFPYLKAAAQEIFKTPALQNIDWVTIAKAKVESNRAVSRSSGPDGKGEEPSLQKDEAQISLATDLTEDGLAIKTHIDREDDKSVEFAPYKNGLVVVEGHRATRVFDDKKLDEGSSSFDVASGFRARDCVDNVTIYFKQAGKPVRIIHSGGDFCSRPYDVRLTSVQVQGIQQQAALFRPAP